MGKLENPSIRIVAPSGVVPRVEFEVGVKRIRDAGFSVKVGSEVKLKSRFYAGTSLDRSQSFWDAAQEEDTQVIWCARGGYGGHQILPLLTRFTAEQGKPVKKLLVGYSDATSLLEYVRTQWGWSTLHAHMPGIRSFATMPEQELQETLDWLREKGIRLGDAAGFSQNYLAKTKLKFFNPLEGKTSVEGLLVGGNLTVWTTLLGTPIAPKVEGKFLFFEDISENLCRIERMLVHLESAGGFKDARGILLGNFLDCNDAVAPVLKPQSKKKSTSQIARWLSSPKPQELMPLRKAYSQASAFREIFGELGKRLRIPIAYGLPCGHGPGHFPLPLGATYRVSAEGGIQLLDWK